MFSIQILSTLALLCTSLHSIGASPVKGTRVSGPVISANFPDPALIEVNGTWYSFATRTKESAIHIQVASSPDFSATAWTLTSNSDGSQKDALPILPAWVDQTSWNTWAPSVHQLDSGEFIMYFAATTNDGTGLYHCVGAATSATVEGPYVGQPDSLFCPLSAGGAIDPNGFKDVDGQRYVVYKVDGNSLGHGGDCGNSVSPIVPTPLILQPVAADGVTLNGTATTLLNNAGASDDGIIEAPSLARSSAGEYVLFFSSGCFVQSDYTVSYATARSVTGPYTRNPTPLFKTGDFGLDAPGSATVWSDAEHVVFHANYGSGRALYTAQIKISGTTVSA